MTQGAGSSGRLAADRTPVGARREEVAVGLGNSAMVASGLGGSLRLDGGQSEGSEKRRGDPAVGEDKGGPVLLSRPARPQGSLEEGRAGEGLAGAAADSSWTPASRAHGSAMPQPCQELWALPPPRPPPSLARHGGSEAVPRGPPLRRTQARAPSPAPQLLRQRQRQRVTQVTGREGGREGNRLRAEPVRVKVCGVGPTGLMRPRWSPGSSRCWFGARPGRGGSAAPGGGARLLAGGPAHNSARSPSGAADTQPLRAELAA